MTPAGPTTRRVESPLGDWSYTTWRPPGLRDVVRELGVFEGRLALSRERVFPDGAMDLIVQLENRYRPAGAAQEPYPLACFNGVMEGAHVIAAPPGATRVLSIKLRPAAYTALFGGGARHVAGVTVDLRELARDTEELVDRCQAAPTPAAMLEVAAGWLTHRLRQGATADPETVWLAERIARAGGQVSIGRLQELAGGSPSRLSRRFREQIGVTPKRFARIHRFRRALDAMHRDPGCLSSVALAAGFYDQAHMNAEFRAHAGMTPGAYLRARRYPGSASLAEA